MALSNPLRTFGLAGLSLVDCSVLADETYTQYEAGAVLAEEEVVELEGRLASDPDDTSARAQLLGYYSDGERYWNRPAQVKKTEHTLWFIRNAPDSEILQWEQDVDPCDDPAAYLEGKRMWMEHLEREPGDLVFFRNAAEFMSFEDSDLTIELLRQGQQRDPANPEWALQLGMWLSFEIEYPPFSGTIDVEIAEQALVQYERAYELLSKRDKGRALEELGRIALLAGQTGKARDYAESMLAYRASPWDSAELAGIDPALIDQVKRGTASKHAQLHHNAHIVLGKLAVAQGELKEAKARLLRAVPELPASDLRWLRPDLSLAQSLLERGQRKVVLKYFKLCARFWQDGRRRLENWIVLLRNGRDLPRSWYR